MTFGGVNMKLLLMLSLALLPEMVKCQGKNEVVGKLQILRKVIGNVNELGKSLKKLQVVIRKSSQPPRQTGAGNQMNANITNAVNITLKPRRNLSKEPRYIAMYYTARRKLCPEYACSKNEVVTYNKNGTVKVPRYGELIKCGQKQIFLTDPTSKTDAMSHYTKCCKIGGNAAVIEDMDELKCVQSQYEKLPVSMKEAGKKTTYFLISGYDIYLNRTFFTCPDFHIIPDDMWANKEPNNLGNMECFVAMAFGEKFGFMDFGITTSLRYACQFPLDKKAE